MGGERRSCAKYGQVTHSQIMDAIEKASAPIKLPILEPRPRVFAHLPELLVLPRISYILAVAQSEVGRRGHTSVRNDVEVQLTVPWRRSGYNLEHQQPSLLRNPTHCPVCPVA